MQGNRGIFFAFFSALVLVTMNNTLPIMAGPYIVGELGGSNQIAFYGVTFYSIGNALGVPLGRRCLGRVRPELFFIIVCCSFAILSVFTAFVQHYPVYLIFRVILGVVAGTVFPFISGIFGILSKNQDKDRISYTMITIFTVAPATAAAFGGWIAYDYHWQWLYYLNFPLFMICGFYLWNHLRQRNFFLEKAPFDIVGYIFYALTISVLGSVVTLGQELDWFRSPLITGMTVCGLMSMLFFIMWELYHPYPILDLRLLKNLAFSFALFNLALLFSAYFGMVILLSLWLNLWVNYTPIWIGLIIGTMAVAGFLPRLLFWEGYERMDTRWPLAISILLLALSSYHTMLFNIEIDLKRIAVSRIIAGFGLAFFLSPLFRLSFHTFKAAKTMTIVNYFQLTRVLSGGLGAAFYSTMWQRRQAFFHDRLGSQLTIYSKETHEYYDKATQIDIHGQQANAELANLLDRQSTALALDDCFYFMYWVMLGLLILIIVTFCFPKASFFPEKKNRET